MVYNNVIKYCNNFNMSISAFEQKCGLPNGLVGKWKDGSEPSLMSLTKIVKATGISVENWIKE